MLGNSIISQIDGQRGAETTLRWWRDMPKGRVEHAHKVPVLKIPSLISRYLTLSMGIHDL